MLLWEKLGFMGWSCRKVDFDLIGGNCFKLGGGLSGRGCFFWWILAEFVDFLGVNFVEDFVGGKWDLR